MVQIIVFFSGIAAVVAVFLISASGRDSETSLLYIALVSYVTYLLSSAAVSFSITTRPRKTWAATYLLAMLPVVLLTSWPPITASWTFDLPTSIPRAFVAAAGVLSNIAFCYASAWILLWLRGRSDRRSRGMQIVLTATAIVMPIAFWGGQVWTGLRAKGL
jgi:hypothetical protein